MKRYRTFAALGALLALSACGTYFNQPVAPTTSRTGETTSESDALRSLPLPAEPIVVGVYNFKDQTGQYKAVENASTFSTAVPQGATTMLIKALEDSKWFTPIERENLSNLLNERNIIRSTRQEYTGDQSGQPNLPPLLYAGILLEGGIISYDTNIITGGYGARYFGVGGSAQYRQDRITIYLRAVSTSNGKILKTVYVSKTILSQALDASLFRYVKFQRLLEVETGITKNEPIQLAIQNAIENAVESLIIEGIQDNLWSTAEGLEVNDSLVLAYNLRKQEEESSLLYNRSQAGELRKSGLSVYGNAPVFNGDFTKKSLGVGGGLRYSLYLTPHLDLGLRGDYFYFTGGQNFYKEYMSANLNLGYTILPRDRFTPYVYGGGGRIFDLRSPKPGLTEDPSGFNFQYGLALKYRVNPGLSIFISAENNHTTTDALDDVVNGVRDDFYSNFSLGLEWRFGKNISIR
ncbi:CsgG/HfaB family protein [Robiginitalea sediminis]|uniref:CsgG/HfaB family protein n=1 Tax=Robiginitalea sediminis TaxID=1982593 RepID=UPI000B4B693C|nr:CsgG/HfaB family protein [Robiginitalea sediminis]